MVDLLRSDGRQPDSAVLARIVSVGRREQRAAQRAHMGDHPHSPSKCAHLNLGNQVHVVRPVIGTYVSLRGRQRCLFGSLLSAFAILMRHLIHQPSPPAT
jgi:hypothetical protein